MGRTAIQLHTLRDVDGSVPAVVERVGETAFDGVEFFDAQLDAFADRTTLDRTVDALDAAGLAVPAIHAGIERLESETDDVLAVCRELDCARLVVPTYDGEAFATVDAIDAAADRIAAVAADLARDDVELLYHNHTFEFDPVDGTVAFERFVDAGDGRFGFEPDVGLAAHAGYDPLDLLDVVSDRAPVVHLTDSVPDDPDALHADPGEGVVDLAACAEAATADGAAADGGSWLVCENGVSTDQVATLERGSEVFADLRERTDVR